MERRPHVAIHPPKRHDELLGISLCAGVAGLDLGVHIAEPGYRNVCFVERNSFAAAALVARMADTSLAPAPVWDDLKSFDGRPWRGRIHILTAGYPCQPFTLSGLRQGENDPRHLWPDVARITGEIAPEWVFFENVPGHLTLGFQDVTRDLQAMGYRVAAASYQRRKSAHRIPAKGSSFWPTPTFKGSGNRACIIGSAAGIQFKTDQNQTGSQIGIKNAASAWTLMWDLMTAAGWTPQLFHSSHRFRVILLNGEKHSTDPLSLNPAFTDWMMGWPSGLTDPLRPVTEWSHWLRRMRIALCALNSDNDQIKQSLEL